LAVVPAFTLIVIRIDVMVINYEGRLAIADTLGSVVVVHGNTPVASPTALVPH